MEVIKYISDLFLPLPDISDGNFFGGFAFKSNGKQFAMIMGNTLYFCVDNTSRPNYENLGMVPFSYSTKKGTVKVRKYFSVPEDLFEDHEKLIVWANEAIRAAYSH
ncbi:MAG: TfoX family protein [Chitinophagaceae bacterium]|nr:MAG: TfoX family protein [Chitinophagaceae bacterium]